MHGCQAHRPHSHRLWQKQLAPAGHARVHVMRSAPEMWLQGLRRLQRQALEGDAVRGRVQVEAAEDAKKQIVLINPLLGDMPSHSGIMGVRGREVRLQLADSFKPAYHFRLLYFSGSMYPIMGAVRFEFGGRWQVRRPPRVCSGAAAGASLLRRSECPSLECLRPDVRLASMGRLMRAVAAVARSPSVPAGRRLIHRGSLHRQLLSVRNRV